VAYLHVKDRNAATGVELGHGNAHIEDMLRFVRDNRHPIGFFVELEFRGDSTPAEEAKKQFEYMRKVLES
jgi:hypothetical protein